MCVCVHVNYGWGLNRYDFVPPVQYKYLNDEEAEAQFERRHRTLNYFSVMMNKRIKDQEGERDTGVTALPADRVSCPRFEPSFV